MVCWRWCDDGEKSSFCAVFVTVACLLCDYYSTQQSSHILQITNVSWYCLWWKGQLDLGWWLLGVVPLPLLFWLQTMRSRSMPMLCVQSGVTTCEWCTLWPSLDHHLPSIITPSQPSALPSYPIVDVPVQHGSGPAVCIVCAVQHQPEPTVHSHAPPSPPWRWWWWWWWWYEGVMLMVMVMMRWRWSWPRWADGAAIKPPLWRATHVAPRKESPQKLCTAMSEKEVSSHHRQPIITTLPTIITTITVTITNQASLLSVTPSPSYQHRMRSHQWCWRFLWRGCLCQTRRDDHDWSQLEPVMMVMCWQ